MGHLFLEYSGRYAAEGITTNIEVPETGFGLIYHADVQSIVSYVIYQRVLV